MDTQKTPHSTQTVLGQSVTISFESGRMVTMNLRQIRVREFAEAMPILGNEAALIEMALGVARGSLLADADPITPESYDALAEAFHALNRPFFAYCTRQSRLVSQVQGKTLERALTAALERSLSNSAVGSSGSPSPVT